jgi:hypothetical protein
MRPTLLGLLAVGAVAAVIAGGACSSESGSDVPECHDAGTDAGAGGACTASPGPVGPTGGW